MGEKKASIQIVWGLLLILAGVGVLIRVNLLESEIKTVASQPSAQLFIHICVYIMAVLLIGGGVRKIRNYLKKDRSPHSNEARQTPGQEGL